MSLKVTEMSFELIDKLRPLMASIRRKDKSLADQLARAANSIALNLAEGEMSDPGTQRSRFFSAAGSANESRAALRLAVGWRHIQPAEAAEARALLDRILGMLWRLTQR
ncbi:MAG: hypothetical protein K0R38_6551 [Polyangiaceae bacterium]|jgi:four helix bundle protein|nr:hypothetical protein [Polyangiaceae bacterium]